MQETTRPLNTGPYKYVSHNVNVTQECITRGTVADSRSCMIAEALKDSIPNIRNVSVDLATIRYTDRPTGNRYIFMTPWHAQQGLISFDQGLKPKPFKFKLQTLFQIRPKIPTKPTLMAATTGPHKKKGTRKLVPLKSSKYQYAPVKIGGREIPHQGYIRRFGLKMLPRNREERHSSPISLQSSGSS